MSYSGKCFCKSAPAYVDVLSGDEFRAMALSLSNQGIAGLSPQALTRLGSENTNWQKEIYQNAIGQDHNLSLAGS